MPQTAALQQLDDAHVAGILRDVLNAKRHYDDRFREMSLQLGDEHVKARVATCADGRVLIAVWVRRVDTTMHHVVGSAIRTLWPGIEYCADVRW